MAVRFAYFVLTKNMKRVSREPGSIRVTAIGCPKIDGWETIPAWSRGTDPYKNLSPFKLGNRNSEGIAFSSFENFWQSFKVWEKVDAQKGWNWTWPEEIHVDKDNNPNENWKKWHDALLSNPHPIRRPNGRAIPLYAWWNGKKLSVIEARKQIYIPELQKLYRNDPAYQKLLEKVREGQNIIIVEPDGAPLYLYPQGFEVNIDLLTILQDVTKVKDFPGSKLKSDKYVPYGHGYVIALTILEDLQRGNTE